MAGVRCSLSTTERSCLGIIDWDGGIPESGWTSKRSPRRRRHGRYSGRHHRLLPQVDKSVGVFELTSVQKSWRAGRSHRSCYRYRGFAGRRSRGHGERRSKRFASGTSLPPKERRRFTGQGTVLSAMFMPDGLTVLTSSADGAIRRVDLFDAR